MLLGKQINGAVLDVLEGEPNSINRELIEYAKGRNNLIITPHIGGCTYESFERIEKFVYNKLLKKVEE
jgi:D-3-phosphoglycerate dehydrogenase